VTDYAAATLWVVVCLAGAGTQALRFSFVVAFAWIETVPPNLARALELVPAAVLAALVLPAVVAPDGVVVLAYPRLVAALVALLVAWYTENVAATIGIGMAVLLVLQAA